MTRVNNEFCIFSNESGIRIVLTFWRKRTDFSLPFHRRETVVVNVSVVCQKLGLGIENGTFSIGSSSVCVKLHCMYFL